MIWTATRRNVGNQTIVDLSEGGSSWCGVTDGTTTTRCDLLTARKWHQTLGICAAMSRVRGSQQKAKRDIRVAAIFKDALAAFLRMLDVDELTQLREGEHGKAIYVKSQHLVGCHRNWSSTPTVADSVGVGRP